MIKCQLILVMALTAGFAVTSRADFTATFEDQGLAANAFNNNAGAGGQFLSGGQSFNNNFRYLLSVVMGCDRAAQGVIGEHCAAFDQFFESFFRIASRSCKR